MIFGQLIECNMRSILLKDHRQCGGETSPRRKSLKNQN